MAEFYWSDVSHSLGLSKILAKYINEKFGGILGITSENKVPKGSLGGISMIATLLDQGCSDEEITRILMDSKKQSGWPDVVLSRINEEVASTRVISRISQNENSLEVSLKKAEYSWSDSLDDIIGDTKMELTLQDMILDLRREICANTVSEEQQILRLTQAVERLIAEVRNLRYALVMAASRKDRKKGFKGLSRLLTH